MSFNRGRLHTHIEDGGIYELIDAAALLKHPDTGTWLPGIIYRCVENSPIWASGLTA